MPIHATRLEGERAWRRRCRWERGGSSSLRPASAMALNRDMHPRNRYKDKPPDFALLASRNPEFKKHVQTDLSGRVRLNFKEPEAVRALTCALLQEDFGLSIEIPLERLIPTLPLRLNYIHWVEDLLGSSLSRDPEKSVHGIDIGTGASCIYPLLGATMNGWHFLATEVDNVCFTYATQNVARNGLQGLVRVMKVPQKTLLVEALNEDPELAYDFCVCNPPFFANQQEAYGVNSRNSHRPPPSSVNTGGATEIMAEGGELEFVRKIIHDSLQLQKRIRWYTCMLGKKCSLAPLKEELRRCGVPRTTTTTFCQGRTMRWALAWSFHHNLAVPSPPAKRRKLDNQKKPITFFVAAAAATGGDTGQQLPTRDVPPPSPVERVSVHLETLLAELKVQHRRVPCGTGEVSLMLTAPENTWIHLRRKRRQSLQTNDAPEPPESCSTQAPTLKQDSRSPAKHSSSDESDPKAPSSTSPQPPPPQLLSAQQPDQDEQSSGQGSSRDGGTEPHKNGKCMAAWKLTEANEPREGRVAASDDAADLSVGEKAVGVSGAPQGTPPGGFVLKCQVVVRDESRMVPAGGGGGGHGRSDDVAVDMYWIDGQHRELLNQLSCTLRNKMLRLGGQQAL
ncbi:RNA N(6)-adenosine-methyltransferase METTL16 isoform X1 [Petromyzon marinus]|uniref:RNA N(6)-adenosine-methyltransferase METTL16 isoform X1 n=2 Tax=Petromyzon marinus TaxID=7757 RepID=UPI003F711363